MPKTHSDNEFTEAYKQLNPAQKEAVDTIDGPVMVLAGPGTGKTQIIATRIANILKKTDTDPSAILALTFTESATKNMRDRLLSLIGPDAYQVHLSTFHSFCTSVINEFPESFIFSGSQKPLTDIDRFTILNDILTKLDLEVLRPINAPLYYSSAVISSIQQLKREGVTPEALHEILKSELEAFEAEKDELKKTEYATREKNLKKNLELLKIYASYQDSLEAMGYYDFEDMINWVVTAFQTDEELLTSFQERFHYFLVDEYQDTNSAQNKLVNHLASYWGDAANLFVVGDPNQSIFRFQGANLENTLGFLKTYPKAKTITLIENYRSQQTILDASANLLKDQHSPLKEIDLTPNLHANRSFKAQKLTTVHSTHQLLESLYLTESIQQLIDDGVPHNEIAIIGRNNFDLDSVADIFERYDIPYRQLGGQDVLDTLPIKYLLKLFTVIKSSRTAIEDLDMFTLLHYPFLDIDPLDILKLTRAAAKSKNGLTSLILSDTFKSKKIVSNPDQFTTLIDKIAEFNQVDSNHTFSEFVEIVLEKSGLMSWSLNHPNSSEILSLLNAFFDFVKQLNAADTSLNLDKFLDTLDLMRQNNLKVTPPELDLTGNQVVLTTAHKAKGLEWDHVFIISCYEGKWSNARTRELIKLPPEILENVQADSDPLEEERRLFYVALTRARKSVTLTYADVYPSYGRDKEVVKSKFIAEIDAKYFENQDYQPEDQKVNDLLKKLVSPATSDSLPSESEFLKNILKDFKLSVTALNTYLECPYKFKLNNLLRVPKAKQSYLAFGTAVHAALENFYNHYLREEIFPDKNHLIDTFRAALKNEVLTPTDEKVRLKQGEKILSAYYDTHLADTTPALATEKFLGYGFSSVRLDDIPLAGKIDRVDWIDQSDRTVKVVDYKTGKRKTRGQIEGTTADSDGAYKRQLVFYKLLVDLDKKFPVEVGESELDFVETPSSENKSGKESFKITSEDVEELKEIIRHCMKEIRGLKFPRTTDYSVCQNCDFIDHCWPQGVPTIQPEQLKLT